MIDRSNDGCSLHLFGSYKDPRYGRAMEAIERPTLIRLLQLPPYPSSVRRPAIDPNARAGGKGGGRREQKYDSSSNLGFCAEPLQGDFAGDLVLNIGVVFRLITVEAAGCNCAWSNGVH